MYHWIIFVITSLFAYTFIALYKKTIYFSKWGIPQPHELPFIGIMHAMIFPRRHVNDFMKYIYATNQKAKYIGCHIFLNPIIVIRDLDLVKAILIKNFEHFADRETLVDESADPLLGQNLNFLNGERWREVRSVLTPSFTASKLRVMYELISHCAENFTNEFSKHCSDDSAINMKDVFSKYTNDIIASCAFGIKIDSLKDPTNEFYIGAKQITSSKILPVLKILLSMMFPTLTRKLHLKIVPKRVTNFFIDTIRTMIKMRDELGIIKPDMLQLMMNARNRIRNDTEAKFDLLEMSAQAFFFYLASYESNSVQICLIAQELAVNLVIQKKIQIEIDSVLKVTNGKLTFDAINNNMPYLDAVFSESLRKYPLAFLNRKCTKDFELPPALPGSKPFKVQPGTHIIIPIAAIQNDPNYYKDPETFNPDRFMNKKVMNVDVLNLGFGMGPRMCIGKRFAVLQIKIILVHLLIKYKLSVCEKTCLPFEYCPNTFGPSPKKGFWLKVEVRDQTLQS